jgi:hypothetical protein
MPFDIGLFQTFPLREAKSGRSSYKELGKTPLKRGASFGVI